MDFIDEKIINYLPKYEQIEKLISDCSTASYIFKLACDNIVEIRANNYVAVKQSILKPKFLIESLMNKLWETIHSGLFSEIPVNIRKIYAISAFFKIFYMLISSDDVHQIERCYKILDEAFLFGALDDLYAESEEYQVNLVKYFDNVLGKCDEISLTVIQESVRSEFPCDIQQIDCPSLETFKNLCFDPLKPALLFNSINHWPALTKWRDLNYLLQLAGNRTVPIEIGSNYTTDEWSQQLMKLKDFLKRQFITQSPPVQIEYLAQHELFEQISKLKDDIRIPDYCVLGEMHNGDIENKVDTKAWLGPRGTISPLHYDPKHNLLCQVFGSKKLILADPLDSVNLYPVESEFLSNTSRINATTLDLFKYPLVANVKFYHLTLQEGDCVYIPPKWWHYVESLSPSFSVSFWWN